jgi:hypothetical protein
MRPVSACTASAALSTHPKPNLSSKEAKAMSLADSTVLRQAWGSLSPRFLWEGSIVPGGEAGAMFGLERS